jgi:PAS domain S-box-containing protein
MNQVEPTSSPRPTPARPPVPRTGRALDDQGPPEVHATLAALSREVALVLDAQLRVRATSASTRHLLGVTSTELRGRPFLALVADDAHAAVAAALAAVLRSDGAHDRRDVRLRTAAGSIRTFTCECVNLLADPALAGLVVHLRDVHDARTTERALRATCATLMQRLRSRDAVRHVDAALARAAHLLLHCEREDEVREVVAGTLPTLLPGCRTRLLLERPGVPELVGIDDAGTATYVGADACWALRTRRTHRSAAGGLLRCEHLDDDRRGAVDAACLPLVMGGHAFGLVIVTAATEMTAGTEVTEVTDGTGARDALVDGSAVPPTAALDRLAARLSVAFARVRPADARGAPRMR